MRRLHRRSRRGFTLIELLTTISVIMLLASQGVSMYLGVTEQAETTRAKAHLYSVWNSARHDRAFSLAGQAYSAPTALASYSSGETNLDVVSGVCPFDGGPALDTRILVDEDRTDDQTLTLFVKAATGEVWRLQALGDRQPVVSRSTQCSPPAPNVLPQADFSYMPAAPQATRNVTFTNASVDLDGDLTLIEWDLDGDGAFDDGTGETVVHAYPTAGARQVSVRATDDRAGADVHTEQVVIGAAPPTYAQVIASRGPGLYWPMNIVGGEIADISGNGFDGNVAGGSVSNSAIGVVPGGSLFFNGGYIAGPTANELGIRTGDWTFEAWVNAPVLTDPKAVGGAREAGALWVDGDRPLLWAEDGTTLIGAATMLPNQWYHIVGTRQGNILSIYLNGILVGTSDNPNLGTTNGNTPTRIGADPASPNSGDRIRGNIDEVAIYSRALSAAEVLGNYQAATG
ncbi:LamG-like jellyroll fold domain-containing protein [Miltoncostaea oceani]|uniref:LamG-like jellyroll fold domain-containing protein n=1 Tax=Miltoncostaea oceani TaxID=2843216 RepID=UPI001C3CF8F9|nr:LamG-like jellyroll fold domain-containing protein [Miltoncostaea oceani]